MNNYENNLNEYENDLKQVADDYHKKAQLRKELWLKFVETGEIDARVPRYVANSWRRSESFGISPGNSGYGKLASGKEIEKILDKNKELIQIATPIIENTYKALNGMFATITLYDHNATVLILSGNPKLCKYYEEVGLLVGSCWQEQFAGSSGVSVCLAEQRPVLLLSNEIYCKQSSGVNDAAAPIRNGQGEIIGVLEISNSQLLFSEFSLGVATAVASLIEKQIGLNNINKLYSSVFGVMSEGVMSIDANYKVELLNRSGQKILHVTEKEIEGQDIRTILKDVEYDSIKKKTEQIQLPFYVKDSIVHCLGEVYRTNFDQESMNGAIVFREEKIVKQMVNIIMGNAARYTFEDIQTCDPKMLRVIEEGRILAENNCNLLITGESGTGKELFAHAIHNASKRKNKPFVAINCAALPRDLMESEIFGYEEGAFTGARKEGHPGKFELADGGTLFLDEIGEFPIDLQPKLLRALDNHRIMRVGGNYEKEMDVRVISATNRDLKKEVENNNFRLDLFFRINVVSLNIPPLDQRKKDIRLLVESFLDNLNRAEKKGIGSVSQDALYCLENYYWEGNVRQLQNVITRAYYLCRENVITSEYLSVEMRQPTGPLEKEEKNISLAQMEKGLIINAILARDGKVLQAARDLKMSKSTIYRKIKRYGIDVTNLCSDHKVLVLYPGK